MRNRPGAGARSRLRRVLDEADRVDLAIYAAVAERRTPASDRALGALSRAADYSRLSIAAATVLALAGGSRGRRAATQGLASVVVTATIVNAVMKPILGRPRPDRPGAAVTTVGRVPMPRSRSFPSGHSAAAFAFAVGAGRALPAAAAPLTALAALVSYSRIHTGVHYPSDVVAGALCGIGLAGLTGRLLRRQLELRRLPRSRRLDGRADVGGAGGPRPSS